MKGSIEGQGHFLTLFFLGFVYFVLVRGPDIRWAFTGPLVLWAVYLKPCGWIYMPLPSSKIMFISSLCLFGYNSLTIVCKWSNVTRFLLTPFGVKIVFIQIAKYIHVNWHVVHFFMSNKMNVKIMWHLYEAVILAFLPEIYFCLQEEEMRSSESYEPLHEKTGFLHMRKQRRRSASR